MLDQILNTEHHRLTDIVKNHSDIPANQTEAATNTIQESVTHFLSERAKSGDLSGIMEMFSGTHSDTSSTTATGLSSEIVKNLSGKLGINPATAANLVQQVLPVILNMFNDKANTAKKSGMDIGGMIGQLMSNNHEGQGLNASAILNIFNNNNNNQDPNKSFGLGDAFEMGKKLF
ncbi:MAG TPA: DUF937 domain-containing protein [Cytophagales bacterium]|nr:DUF937 domain-containing protein [Cytophagales bacterium]